MPEKKGKKNKSHMHKVTLVFDKSGSFKSIFDQDGDEIEQKDPDPGGLGCPRCPSGYCSVQINGKCYCVRC